MGRIFGVLFWSIVCSIQLERYTGADTPLLLTVLLSALLGVIMTALSVLLSISWRGLTSPTPEVVLPRTEAAIASADAWHIHGLDPRRGRLFVTSAGLRFVPSAFSVDHRPLFLPTAAITSCRADNARRVRVQVGDRAAALVLPQAALVALWVMDVVRGDRDLDAILDIEGFTPEAPDRGRLTAARPSRTAGPSSQ